MHDQELFPEVEKGLREGRIRARRLLKQFRSEDRGEALKAATQLRKHPKLSALTAEALLEDRGRVQLKHALDIVAMRIGYGSWAEMKRMWEGENPLPPREILTNLDSRKIFGSGGAGAYLHSWYRNYKEAKAAHREKGGYLLPHGDQCLIAEAGYIEAVGLNPDDPDWERIGYDWVQPVDSEAFARLDRQLDRWRLRLQEAAKQPKS